MAEKDKDQNVGPVAGRAPAISPAAKKDQTRHGEDSASPGAAEDEARAERRRD